MNKRSLTYGFIVGGIVGAVSALLTAPTSGKELRAQIKDTKDNWIETMKDITANLNDLKSSVTTLSSESKDIFVKVVSDIKNAISEWKEDTEPNKQVISDEIAELQRTIERLENTIKNSK